jgi:hypothetical protein
MQQLINNILDSYPTLNFVAGKQFCWSPETEEIYYSENAVEDRDAWSLLHETGHALLGHKGYEADVELIRLEVEAWEKARHLGKEFDVDISQDHIEDCLDTYRDWLYKRSICPNCSTKSLQQGDFVHYRCFNCHTTWKVTASRFCRAYRRQKNVPQTKPVFHSEGFSTP